MKKKLRKILLAAFFLCILCGLQIDAYAAGEVHTLVMTGADSAKNGGNKMEKCLKNIKIPLYKASADNVHRFSFDSEHKGKGTTLAKLKNQIKNAYKNSTNDDLNIFYYSGHSGIVVNTVDGKDVNDYSSACMVLSEDLRVPVKTVIKELAKYKGKFMLIMDTCYSYTYYKYGVALLDESVQSRFNCITATGYDEPAESNGVTKIGFFTSRLLKGVGYTNSYTDMPADANLDGVVTPNEIVAYAGELSLNDIFNTAFFVGNEGDMSLFQFAYTKQAKSSATVRIDGTKNLTAVVKRAAVIPLRQIKWRSSNTKIATVDERGKVTGKKCGKVKITSYLTDTSGNTIYGSESSCKVEVLPSITLDQSEATVKVKKSLKLTATVKGASAKSVKWKSSNKKVATVSSKGKVTGKKAGTVTITASITGMKAKCKVKVIPQLTLNKKKLALGEGQTYQLKATVKGTSKKVTWKSSDKTIVTVNSKGKVTAKKVGEATITASVGGATATCVVTVVEPVTKTGTYEVNYGSTKTTIIISKVQGNTVTFKMYFAGRYGYGESNKITATASGNKASFKFKDVSSGGKGKGTLTFRGNSIILSSQTTSGTSQLATGKVDETLVYISSATK